MKYAIFSDVHANYEALQAVLTDFNQQGVHRYVFVGDIVGYGAEPRECIASLQDLVRHKRCVCVAGNHDYAVAGINSYEHYNIYAQESIQWTQQQLKKTDMEFLAQLPLVERVPIRENSAQQQMFTIVHANLIDPAQWGYILDIDDAYPNFKILKDAFCFIGHSHKPIIFVEDQFIDWFIQDEMEMADTAKYIINIGSVGQPRDGNPDACYVIFDDESSRIEIRRVAYNISKTQEKIIRAGLPPILAERLSVGK